jgi:hypothetical protein
LSALRPFGSAQGKLRSGSSAAATLVRAVKSPDGIRHLEKPDYHSNPIDTAGSLVVTEWGRDFVDFIYQKSGMVTSIYLLRDKHMGLAGEFLEVFVSSRGAPR